MTYTKVLLWALYFAFAAIAGPVGLLLVVGPVFVVLMIEWRKAEVELKELEGKCHH